MARIGVLQRDGIVLQMARSSFDVHLQEILSSLVTGASVVMLRPRGTLDFIYLSSVFETKQITCMASVPSLLLNFYNYLIESGNEQAISSLRSLISGGI